MPGWHQATKEWVKAGKLVILGVTQEQHPERCRLFAQWHQMDWPIVHDPINIMGNSAVPIAVAIDEHGVVQSTRPNPRTFEKEFLDKEFPQPKGKPKTIGVESNWKDLQAKAKASGEAGDWQKAGDSIVLWAGQGEATAAISCYEAALEIKQDPKSLFRLGVAYQMRYESSARRPGDFASAVEHWQKALDANPNQYIWRRRIQQYGPRLDKPYPFYDWVTKARKEIVGRGETPVKLPVEPVGAELATRSRSIEGAAKVKNPDPEAKILRDALAVVSVDPVVVPHTYKAQTSSMVHVVFEPRVGVTWSNEAGPLQVWLEGKKVKLSRNLFSVTNKKELESQEPRKIEVEVLRSGPAKLKGFALYYVCEKGW